MSEQLSQPSPDNAGEATGSNMNPAASDQQPAVTTDTNAQIAAAVPIEIDEGAEDSGYGESDADSYLSSLLSDVTDYQYENGRRYHGYRKGAYLLPNDEIETERLDVYHHLMGILNGGLLHRAPLHDPQRILDIGTGAGNWAIDMGDQYPSAQVLGIDISPIQPSWIPPNVQFEVEDAEDTWPERHPFDLIHCRYMPACISDFPKLLRQVYQHTAPGGWAEFSDWDLNVYSQDGTLTKEHPFKQMHSLFIQSCDVMGRIASPGQHLEEWFRAAGFENVNHVVMKLPFGTWPKDKTLKYLGQLNRIQIEGGVEAFTFAPFTRALGWSVDEVQRFLVDVRKDCANKDLHSVYDYHIVYAQKPADKTLGDV